eukprot:GFYU01036699.1.p1 GENE.GFYU01036699.1~~GFYU01036699.1.p1  ORF type:complete len:345 (+),score=36.19 GFYU01036699.1:92-1126(+)
MRSDRAATDRGDACSSSTAESTTSEDESTFGSGDSVELSNQIQDEEPERFHHVGTDVRSHWKQYLFMSGSMWLLGALASVPLILVYTIAALVGKDVVTASDITSLSESAAPTELWFAAAGVTVVWLTFPINVSAMYVPMSKDEALRTVVVILCIFFPATLATWVSAGLSDDLEVSPRWGAAQVLTVIGNLSAIVYSTYRGAAACAEAKLADEVVSDGGLLTTVVMTKYQWFALTGWAGVLTSVYTIVMLILLSNPTSDTTKLILISVGIPVFVSIPLAFANLFALKLRRNGIVFANLLSLPILMLKYTGTRELMFTISNTSNVALSSFLLLTIEVLSRLGVFRR